MDAVKFIEERNRMCKSFGDRCTGCPASNGGCAVGQESTLDATDQVAMVEEWSAAHPRKTRQSVLLEQWPNCMLDGDCVVGMCPRNVDKNYICDLNRSAGCSDCRREFWMQEVE
nr:MAG TPA: hypothetical protein [Caudoviricetes sp.]